MATRAVHDVSEDDAGLPSTSLPDGKDEGLQPIVNPVPMPPYVLVDPHYPYWSPFAAMPASFSNCGAYNHIPPPPPTGQLHLLTGGMDSSTRNLPTTISPILLQPALYYVPPPEENKGENLAGANRTFSAVEKGKGKAVHFPDDIPAEPPFPEPDELLSEGHPSLDFPVSKQVPLELHFAHCDFSSRTRNGLNLLGLFYRITPTGKSHYRFARGSVYQYVPSVREVVYSATHCYPAQRAFSIYPGRPAVAC